MYPELSQPLPEFEEQKIQLIGAVELLEAEIVLKKNMVTDAPYHIGYIGEISTAHFIETANGKALRFSPMIELLRDIYVDLISEQDFDPETTTVYPSIYFDDSEPLFREQLVGYAANQHYLIVSLPSLKRFIVERRNQSQLDEFRRTAKEVLQRHSHTSPLEIIASSGVIPNQIDLFI